MFSVFILTEESKKFSGLHSGLSQSGFACSVASAGDDPVKRAAEQAPDLVLVTTNGHPADSRIWELSQEIKRARPVPIIALVSQETLGNLDARLNIIDDFIIEPCNITELVLRVKRLLHSASHTDSSELIKYGGLMIDLAKCEVSVSGRLVELTFREYQLLKFLSSNRGRVFNRETLLNKVWGYDYYGGDRTVDVHIRRLRSKIEDANHTFIETVRNIGYRFRCDD